ncbi:50S ribosomal protein L11 methyltransferase [Sphingomonas sp. NIBR02145]|uniref:class I SAM-dependent methyltransferase n=1 Tax=Sphingomonas sp. NIBR02145 TaxID=3014784 RepID=UPI0022B4D482|nr:50S ribosomal protein L11 methyltransferase [Sphingomonas sp. NIBR02145]WHU03139.1 50S ribosomal protein L11 methyltransferase [Sphingomonas sp. NIBR02145]
MEAGGLSVADFIRERLPLLPVPGIPEIMLHKAVPASGLGRLAARDDAFGSPYWAYYWLGGLALARFVLDRPETVAGRRVLDLGCGSGLVAIAAAKVGAASVRAVDVDRYAVAATQVNAAANGVVVEVALGDLTDGPVPDVDLILAGDVFYDPAPAARVMPFLARCRAAGVEVLVGDPRRAPLPVERLRVLAEYAFAETDSGVMRASEVFAFD